MAVTRPALRYFGGKWRLAPWIISWLPQHEIYIEPFGGAASVLIQKKPAFVEVYNDLNERTVNFFRVLREQPQALVDALRLTPYARREYELAAEPSSDPLEDARRWVILAGQGNRGAGSIDAGGWRWMKQKSRTATPAHEFYKLDHLHAIARRFAGVQIENDTALAVIERYDGPGALIYVDPPYLPDTRCMRWTGDCYMHDMQEQDHIDLAQALQRVKGMVIVSGYQSPLYDELYSGWTRQDHSITLRARSSNYRPNRRVVESLWISPNVRLTQGVLL